MFEDDKKMKIYLTPLGKVVALGELSLRAREEGVTVEEYLERFDEFEKQERDEEAQI